MKEKVNVTGVPETMVQTLYARAKKGNHFHICRFVINIQTTDM